MNLTDVCKREFGTQDRLRGESVSMLHKIDLKEVGQHGVLAVATGSTGQAYLVGIDFSESNDGNLGVYCECERYRSMRYCKHLWATLCKLDLLYKIDLAYHRNFSLFQTHPMDIEIGQRLHSELSPQTDHEPARIESQPQSQLTESSHRKSTRPKKTTTASWKSKLQEVAAVSRSRGFHRSAASPPSPFGPAQLEAQHWFVISVTNPDNQYALTVAIMRSTRRGNGPWSSPEAVDLSRESVSEIVCPRERAAIANLIPTADDYSHYYGDEARAVFAVDPSLLSSSLLALHATGRLAWKLGESQRHFQDAQPISEVQLDVPWQLNLTVQPNATNEKQFDVVPTLCRNDQSISVSRVIWVSEIGCALVQSDDESVDLSGDQGVVPIKTTLIAVSDDHAAQVNAWLQVGTLTVPKRSLRTALRDLSETASSTPIDVDPSLGVQTHTGTPSPMCALQQKEQYETTFDAALSVRYDEMELAFESPRGWWFDDKTRTIYQRNWQAEAGFLESVASDVFEFSRDSFQPSLQVPPESFLEIVETLQSSGWEVTADGAPIRIATDFDISVSSGVDWFDLNADVDFNGVSASLPLLLKALQNGESSVVLDDGSQGMLPKEWLAQFVGVQAAGEANGDAFRFHRTQAMLLDALLDEKNGVKTDRDFTRFVKQLKSFEGIKPADPPKSFSGTLREYQQVGLGWFDFLQRFGFGGCLADDMGLGKTIQVLALLDKRRTRRVPSGTDRKPSIAVVPKSLVGNWIEEAAKFTPKLRVFNYTGSDRKTRLTEAQAGRNAPHLLITTYGTLRNDITDLLEQDFDFDYVILDEAQAIKNPNSQASKATRLLKGDHRLAMTGTPVENHLGDLWALFDFLNPGMLKAGMTSRLPQLDDEEDRKRVEQIGNSLRPFILRRTKTQVLKDLPDKMEQTLSCDMSKPQRKLYDELREHYRVHLSKKVEELGLKRSKIHVLEALLRLRQASCDPRLVKPDCDVRGAKIDLLLSQLAEIIENGHKALVFSQFTSLLSLLRNDIDARKWDYEYLDGKTRKRGEKVKRFQNQDDCQLFLISLKAGGTGLNLTAAQYVFILDPWWNPAVEAQAIDRAHRIGQTNSVNAYRLICSDSVEEKIVELQQNKRDLADAIISQDKSLISDLTSDDLQSLLG